MFKLVVFVPEKNLESVKQALFHKGAGQDKQYKHSCWQVLGEMQYIPLPPSDPAIGDKGELVKVPEYRVEMICSENNIKSVIEELHQVHPYEKPAYEIYKLETFI